MFFGVYINESEIRFWGSASEIRFFPFFYRKRQWGTRGESGGFRGRGEKPNAKQIVKKKSEKAAKSKKKKLEKSDIFILLKMV